MPRGGWTGGKRAIDIKEEEIQREYYGNGRTLYQTAKIMGCSPKILIQAMKNYGMVARSKNSDHHGRSLVHTKLGDHGWLREALRTRTAADIGRELGTDASNVITYARRHDLLPYYKNHGDAVRAGMSKMSRPIPKYQTITKEEITRVYLSEDINMHDACKLLGCSPPTLIAAMHFHRLKPKDNERKIHRVGEHSGRWAGGRIVMKSGYVQIRMPDHPDADSAGNVFEHRWVAEQDIGRRLTAEEQVHHINGVKDDNRPENLAVMTGQEHQRLHHMETYRAMEMIESQNFIISDLENRLAKFEQIPDGLTWLKKKYIEQQAILDKHEVMAITYERMIELYKKQVEALEHLTEECEVFKETLACEESHREVIALPNDASSDSPANTLLSLHIHGERLPTPGEDLA